LDSFKETWDRYKARVEVALEQRLPLACQPPDQLHQAIRYGCLDGGKRFRAMLVYAAGEAFGAAPQHLDGAAVAVELIHAYSLIHDDLPAMDDDDLRRGRLSCHRAFDEATAILAGDAAQSLAFEILSSDPSINIDAERRLRIINVLANATGSMGMAGGQAMDMEATTNQISAQHLSTMHQMKTGALIRASCQIGGLSATATTEADLQELDRFGTAIGLAFQVKDDILDVTEDSETLGKASGADAKMQKMTYVSLFGLDGAKRECDDLYQQAVESAGRLGDNPNVFRQLADFVVSRSF
jgi:farnesyl diphosphate synthase